MPLAGVLRELDFGKYLEGEDFENYLLKNKLIKIWRDNRVHSITLIGKSQSDKSLITFMNVVNQYLNRDAYTEEQKQVLINHINFLIIKFFEFYIKKEEIRKDYNDLIIELEDLKNRGLIYESTVKNIKDLIEKKKYKEIVTKMDSQNIEDFRGQFDYAIITALEEDEMEKVLPLIQKEGIISDSEHLIEYGYVKGMPSKKVVYASQHSTGVIDAGILSTELLLRFKPKFLIMVGVLGGKPLETNIGDVIVASKVFTIDKGKITDLGFQKEINQSAMQSKELARFNREKSQIENFIDDSDPTRKSNINIHFGPIATVNQVIDVEGFFEKEISSIDRKAIALEMESYAVVRACELINRNTKPLIIKSVMDNTSGKTDNAKTYAAWTSAKFLEYILLNDLI